MTYLKVKPEWLDDNLIYTDNPLIEELKDATRGIIHEAPLPQAIMWALYELEAKDSEIARLHGFIARALSEDAIYCPYCVNEGCLGPAKTECPVNEARALLAKGDGK